MKTINDFNLSTRSGRYRARLAGFDVPKLPAGQRGAEFDSLIQKTAGYGCWPWNGVKNPDGYGRYRLDGRQLMAHKIAWERVHGKVPDGLVLMHNCDNPACCNPEHLTVGTQAENIADKVSKERQARGESSGSAVLTDEQVVEMRSLYQFRVVTYRMLADRFGVSKDTAQKAVRGINWSHV